LRDGTGDHACPAPGEDLEVSGGTRGYNLRNSNVDGVFERDRVSSLDHGADIW
jgi:hypothetical protein